MPRFAANLSMLFVEVPFLDRFARAAMAGFKAVEFQFPYDFDKREIATRLSDLGLHCVLFNLPPGDFAKGERGIASLPGRETEFRDGVARALDYAQALHVGKLNCLSGIRPQALPVDSARHALVQNLQYADETLARAGIELLIEPINQIDMPGFMVSRSADAIAIMDRVSSRVKLQYDLYHMQRSEGELTATLLRLMPRIGHIQIANVPSRHEPGTGEINFANMIRHIDALGYRGWIGCEYKPRKTTEEGLSWMQEFVT